MEVILNFPFPAGRLLFYSKNSLCYTIGTEGNQHNMQTPWLHSVSEPSRDSGEQPTHSGKRRPRSVGGTAIYRKTGILQKYFLALNVSFLSWSMIPYNTVPRSSMHRNRSQVEDAASSHYYSSPVIKCDCLFINGVRFCKLRKKLGNVINCRQ